VLQLDKFNNQQLQSHNIHSLEHVQMLRNKQNTLHIPSVGIPNDDHAVWSDVGRDNPSPIIAATRACDGIRLTQQNQKQKAKIMYHNKTAGIFATNKFSTIYLIFI